VSFAPTAVREGKEKPAGSVADRDPEVADADQSSSPPPRSGHLRRGLVAVVLVTTVVVLLVLAFEGPIATVWHDVRQRHRASDLLVGRKHVSEGQTLATLQIPAIKVNEVVVEGDAPDQLRGGPGHRIGTPAPGQRGNSILFGHAQGWGSPFSKLADLRKGDLVVVKTRLGSPTVFTVASVSHVPHDDVRLLAPSKDHRITIVTGDGGYTSQKLWIVSAVSGDPAKLERAPRGLSADPDIGPLPVSTILVALATFVLARVAFVWFRRQQAGLVATLVVVLPLALAGLLATLLLVDQLRLPPLR